MENTNASTTRSPVTKTREFAATAMLRRCGEMLINGLKSVGAAWCDPMTCNAYWIGAHPGIWGVRK